MEKLEPLIELLVKRTSEGHLKWSGKEFGPFITVLPDGTGVRFGISDNVQGIWNLEVGNEEYKVRGENVSRLITAIGEKHSSKTNIEKAIESLEGDV